MVPFLERRNHTMTWFSTIFKDGFCHLPFLFAICLLPFLFPSWRLLHKSIYEGWWVCSWIRCIGINDNDVFDDDDDDDDDEYNGITWGSGNMLPDL